MSSIGWNEPGVLNSSVVPSASPAAQSQQAASETVTDCRLTHAVASFCISSFVGATYSTRVTGLFGVGPPTVVGFLLFGIGTLLLALAREPIVIAGAVLVIWQLFEAPYTVYDINEVSLRQAVTPDRVLGRATASIQFVGIGVYLVGLILGGALAEIAGLRPTLIVAGGCGVLGAVWLFLSPVWKMRELPRAER